MRWISSWIVKTMNLTFSNLIRFWHPMVVLGRHIAIILLLGWHQHELGIQKLRTTHFKAAILTCYEKGCVCVILILISSLSGISSNFGPTSWLQTDWKIDLESHFLRSKDTNQRQSTRSFQFAHGSQDSICPWIRRNLKISIWLTDDFSSLYICLAGIEYGCQFQSHTDGRKVVPCLGLRRNCIPNHINIEMIMELRNQSQCSNSGSFDYQGNL